MVIASFWVMNSGFYLVCDGGFNDVFFNRRRDNVSMINEIKSLKTKTKYEIISTAGHAGNEIMVYPISFL